jgi:hypothetical protein
MRFARARRLGIVLASLFVVGAASASSQVQKTDFVRNVVPE